MTGELSTEQVVDTVNDVMAQRRAGWTPVGAGASLADLALESLDYVELFAALEEVGGFEVDPSSAEELERVGDLVKLRAA
jgi:acyl carrier protein